MGFTSQSRSATVMNEVFEMSQNSWNLKFATAEFAGPSINKRLGTAFKICCSH